MHVSRLPHAFLSTPEEIIDEARNGRMFILVDDEDRENEGDLVVPAQMATPEKINFMAQHGRGLICLAMTKRRTEELGLALMSSNNGTRHQTAFTTSIEAREGVSTGISAADRARTVAVAIDASKGADEIVTPGHIFPLIARDGGVLVRAGHTEAAVDVARLAGLNPSGVICEVMNDDGTMARLDDLVTFAQRHGLKIGTIRDLIAYRLRYDHLVEQTAERSFTSNYGGAWQMLVYRNKVDGSENMVLKKGRPIEGQPTLVRVHLISIYGDMLGEPGERNRLLQRAMTEVGKAGSGIIVLLSQMSSGRLSPAVTLSEPDPENMLRNYGIGAQILSDLGVHEMILLSNTHHMMVGLEGYGLSIVEHRPLPSGPED